MITVRRCYIDGQEPHCMARLYVADQKRGVYPRGVELPKCQNLASYIVNGNRYCKRHATAIVFEMVLGEQK